MVVEQQESLGKWIKTLESSSQDLPLELPLSHLSRRERFEDIVQEGVLKPQIHSVLGEEENVVFLMYGGIFYRSTTEPAIDPILTPVAFVFHPRILSHAYRFFPFDTGMMEKKIGKSWARTLAPIKVKYEIKGAGDRLIPRKLVWQFFGSNANYIRGRAASQLKAGNPVLSNLHDFYRADLTKPDIADGRLEGIDRRKCAIECQFDKEVSLLDDLIWIGFCEEDGDFFSQLYQKHSDPINLRYFSYGYDDIFRPNELEFMLQQKAREAIINLILQQEARRKNGSRV